MHLLALAALGVLWWRHPPRAAEQEPPRTHRFRHQTEGLLLLGWALPAQAHAAGELAGDWVFWLLLLTLSWYVAGLARGGHAPALWRPLLFCTGWALLGVALVGPVEHWAHASLAGHMTQHMMLLAAAPPLLLLARPIKISDDATSSPARRFDPRESEPANHQANVMPGITMQAIAASCPGGLADIAGSQGDPPEHQRACLVLPIPSSREERIRVFAEADSATRYHSRLDSITFLL